MPDPHSNELILAQFRKALQTFLANPNLASKKKLKKASLDIFNLAAEEAKKIHPDKSIGGDEFAPILSDFIYSLNLNNLYYSEEKYQLIDRLFFEFKDAKLGSEAAFPISLAWIALAKTNYLSPQEDTIYSLLCQMEAQTDVLKNEGYITQAPEMNALTTKIKAVTENHFFLNPDEREKQFSPYKQNITDLVNQGMRSEILKDFTPWKTTAANILASISLLGLFYLAASEKHRGSFWRESEKQPSKTLRKAQEALNPKKSGPSSSGASS